MKKAFDDLFAGHVQERGRGDLRQGDRQGRQRQSDRSRVAADEGARRCPDVATPSGAIFDISGTSDLVKLIGRDGKQLGSTPARPTSAGAFEPGQKRFNPSTLTSGNWALGPDQVVIDAGQRQEASTTSVGDTIGVGRRGAAAQHDRLRHREVRRRSTRSAARRSPSSTCPPRRSCCTSRASSTSSTSPPNSGVSRGARGRPGQAAAAGVGPDRDRRRGRQGRGQGGRTTGSRSSSTCCSPSPAIALLVGSFVIFNTLSMTVAQRVRELATLRTLGASRKQVFRSVLLEGFVTGLIAAIVGLFFGLAARQGPERALQGVRSRPAQHGHGLQHADGDRARSCSASASRCSPRSRRRAGPPACRRSRPCARAPRCRRRGSHEPRPPRRSCSASSAVVAARARPVRAACATGARPAARSASGCILLFIGVGLISSRLVRPLAAAVGAPGERFGGAPGALARENATRNPTRTARTAGALMIGLALVTLVATLGASLKSTDQERARGPGPRRLRRHLRQRLRPVHDGRRARRSATRPEWRSRRASATTRRARFGNDGTTSTGVDPATIGHVYDFRWNKGSDNVLLSLGVDGAIVRNEFADDHNLQVGEQVLDHDAAGQEGAARGARHLQAAGRAARPAARRGHARAARLRRALPAAEGPVHLRRHRRRHHRRRRPRRSSKTLGPYPDAVVRTNSGLDRRAGGRRST